MSNSIPGVISRERAIAQDTLNGVFAALVSLGAGSILGAASVTPDLMKKASPYLPTIFTGVGQYLNEKLGAYLQEKTFLIGADHSAAQSYMVSTGLSAFATHTGAAAPTLPDADTSAHAHGMYAPLLSDSDVEAPADPIRQEIQRIAGELLKGNFTQSTTGITVGEATISYTDLAAQIGCPEEALKDLLKPRPQLSEGAATVKTVATHGLMVAMAIGASFAFIPVAAEVPKAAAGFLGQMTAHYGVSTANELLNNKGFLGDFTAWIDTNIFCAKTPQAVTPLAEVIIHSNPEEAKAARTAAAV